MKLKTLHDSRMLIYSIWGICRVFSVFWTYRALYLLLLSIFSRFSYLNFLCLDIQRTVRFPMSIFSRYSNTSNGLSSCTNLIGKGGVRDIPVLFFVPIIQLSFLADKNSIPDCGMGVKCL